MQHYPVELNLLWQIFKDGTDLPDQHEPKEQSWSQGTFAAKLGEIHWHTGAATAVLLHNHPTAPLLSDSCLGWLQEQGQPSTC